MATLTWITGKELMETNFVGRKALKFYSSGLKTRNASAATKKIGTQAFPP